MRQRANLLFTFSTLLLAVMLLPLTGYSAQNQLLMRYNKTQLMSTLMLRLGDGFSTNNRLSVGETALNLSQAKITYTGMQSSVFLTETIDRNELAKILNIDLSANGGWGLFSASASAHYLRHIEDTQYTENFSFMERYYIHSTLDVSNLPANIAALNATASELYHKEGVARFTQRFGDTFITDIPIGAALVTNLQLNFVTALDKQKFDATINGKFGSIFGATLTLQNAINKAKVKGTVEVSAFQIGGNPEALPEIFAKKEDQGYYITTCSLDNLKDCRDAINGIIRYAQVEFKKQINPTNAGDKPAGNLVPVGAPFLTTYTNKFNLLPAPKLDTSILKTRLELATLYNNIKDQKTFFDHYLASPVAAYFTVDAHKLITTIQANLAWNLSLISQFGPMCYVAGEEQNCGETITAVKDNFRIVDEAVVDFYMNNGYNQLLPNCNYIPVGTPTDENPIYANFCLGQWIKGLFVIKMSGDKTNVQIMGDYLTPENRHVITRGFLMRADSNVVYSGKITYQYPNGGCGHKGNITLKVTKNNV